MSSLACECRVKLNAAFLTVALSMKLMEGMHVGLRCSDNLQELGRPILLKAGVLTPELSWREWLWWMAGWGSGGEEGEYNEGALTGL